MSLNARESSQRGDGIHIGVGDSLGRVPIASLDYDVDSVYDDYVPGDEPDPLGHGTRVFDIITSIAPQATFSNFQVLGQFEEDGEVVDGGERSALISGIWDAADAGVDVLNLSLGEKHTCHGLCAVNREAELAVETEHMTIVAATGNKDGSDNRHGVSCPAMDDAVIGVGGYIPRCGQPIQRSDSSSQWWLEGDEIVGPLCGQLGCCNDGDCNEYRNETEWEGNVFFHNAAPDILAPCIDIYGSNTESLSFQIGTSFAAPLVSGLLGRILSDLQIDGVEPTPDEVRNAIIATGNEIDIGDYRKFNATEAERDLYNRT